MYHSRFSSSHYNAGLKYGLKLKNNRKYIDEKLKNINSEMLDFGLKSAIICKKEYPEFLDELKGISDGLEVDFSCFSSFIFCMYNFMFNNYCSCFTFKDCENIIFGRNSDYLVEFKNVCDSCYYHLDNSYSFVGNTTAMSEIEDGVNEFGFAAGLTFVYPSLIKPGLNGGVIVRNLLEKCRDVNEGIEKLKNLTISSSQNILMADRYGYMALVECNCEDINIIRQKNNFLCCKNDFNSIKMKKYSCSIEDEIYSRERYKTMYNFLLKQKKCLFEYASSLLKGKNGFMCDYDKHSKMDTLWSSVYVLNKNEAYIYDGNPKRKTYKVDKRLEYKEL